MKLKEKEKNNKNLKKNTESFSCVSRMYLSFYAIRNDTNESYIFTP